MRGYQVILGLVVLVYGCSLLKQNSNAANIGAYEEMERSRQHRMNESDSLSALVTMHYKKDSLQEAYTIQLWPKGRFSFSAAGGFDGEADSIVISGKRQQILRHTALKTEAGQLKKRQTIDAEQENKVKLKQKDKLKKSSPDYGVLIGIVVLLIIAWRWLVKK